MERKLLFFDIDGTLIPDVNRPVPDSTKQAIREAQAQGHYTFINTGRPKSILPQELLDLEFDGYLCGCGSYITIKDKIIVNKQLSPDRCHEILDWSRKKSMPIIFEGNLACFTDKKGAVHPTFQTNNHALALEFPGRILDVEECDHFQFSKFCIICSSRKKVDEFLEPFSDYFQPIDRGDNFFEIVPIGCSKASAIDTVLSFLDQPLSDCYAFGDSSNDLPMLTHVPNSIAMGNSDELVRKAASYITTPVWRHGIYLAMKHYKLI